jgi:hypothetical protein
VLSEELARTGTDTRCILLNACTWTGSAGTAFRTATVGHAEFISLHKAVARPPADNRPYVLQLGLPPALSAFLRAALGFYRDTPSGPGTSTGIDRVLARLPLTLQPPAQGPAFP